MKGRSLLKFFLDQSDLDKNTAIEYLENKGIDIKNAKDELRLLLKRRKAELKIEKGKELSRKYFDAVKNIKSIMPLLEKDEPELALQFRKLGKESPDNPEDVLSDKDKIRLIEYLIKKRN